MKKLVTDEFPTKQEVLGGFTLTGSLNLSGNEIYGLPDVPTTDSSAASKKYVDSKITTGGGTTSLSGFTMQGINMGGYEVIGLSVVPSFNNSATSKKYVDDEIISGLTGVSGRIAQAQADARYVRKTKIALGEWMDTFDGINFIDYNWSKHVRKSIINVNPNIEIKVASFITDMSISQLNKHKLVIGIAYAGTSSTIKKHLVTIALSGKSFSALSVGLPARCTQITFTKSTILGMTPTRKPLSYGRVEQSTTAYVYFALNEAGQYG